MRAEILDGPLRTSAAVLLPGATVAHNHNVPGNAPLAERLAHLRAGAGLTCRTRA